MATLVTTLAGLRSFSGTPQANDIYEITDYGTGIWYYDSTDTTSADNTGTIVVSGSYRFKRIFSEPVVQATWFGVVADGTTDSFHPLQGAIDFLAGNGTLILPQGTIYLNKALGGALVLPVDAAGLTIQGFGANTIIKLSVNVPVAFTCPGNADDDIVNNYKNITLRDFDIDADNIQGSSYGTAVTATANAVGIDGNYVDVPVTSNTSYHSQGAVFLSYSNTGTTKGLIRSFKPKVGSTTILQITLLAGETILTGDSIIGSIASHVIVGNIVNRYNPQSWKQNNLTLENLTFENIRAYNIPAADENETYIPGPSFSIKKVATVRPGIQFNISNAIDAGKPSGYDGSLYAQNVRCKNVRIEGGSMGILILGTSQDGRTGDNPYFLGDILLKDCYHTTKTVATQQYNSVNFFIGYVGFGKGLVIDNCEGHLAGDVGIEVDNQMDAVVKNCRIYNAFDSGYFSTNDNYPAPTINGRISTTLAVKVLAGATSATLTTIPSGIENTGYMTINNTELVYYKIAYGSNVVTIKRGLNEFTPIEHAINSKVRFLRSDAYILYENCSSENTFLTVNAGIGWLQGRNFILPSPKIICRNISYFRNTPFIGNAAADAMYINTANGGVDIDTFNINIPNITYTATNSLESAAIKFRNSDYGVLTDPPISPAQKIILRDVVANLSGKLNNNSTTFSVYYGILMREGNFNIDFSHVAVSMKFLNTNALGSQARGISLGFNTNYISGIIKNYRFASVGDILPAPLWLYSSTTVGKLFIEDTDLRDMEFDQTTNNTGNFLPFRIDATDRGVVAIRNILPPVILNSATQIVAATAPVVARTSGAYTAAMDDEVIFVSSSSAGITITIPKITTDQSNFRPNAGRTWTIVDVTGNAATYNITIVGSGGELINGAANVKITTNWGKMIIMPTNSGLVAY
jgi:hypothetical protein